MREVMIALAAAVFAGAMSMRILDATLPQVADDYSVSVGVAGASVTAYAVGYSAFQFFYGPVGDRLGLLPVIAVASLCAGVASFGCAMAPSLEWLVMLRFTTGAAAAAIGPLTLAWVSLSAAPGEGAVMIARITGASVLGAMAGQAGGGAFAASFAWQGAFIAVGALFLLSGLALVVLGWMISVEGNLASRRSLVAVANRPGLIALLQRPDVRTILLIVGLEGCLMFMSFTFVSAFLQRTFGPGETSLLVALMGAGGIAFVLTARAIVGVLSDAARTRVGAISVAGAWLALIFAPSTIVVGISLFIMGLAFFMLHNVLQWSATQMARDARAAAVSLFAATFFIGQAAGAAGAGIVFDRLGGEWLFAGSALGFAALGLLAPSLMRLESRPTDACNAREAQRGF